jgi:hypothetical protein
MGSIGDFFDNSVAESFFGTRQLELLDEQHWHSRDQLANAIFDWIEAWYNPHRRHSYCNMLPIELPPLADQRIEGGYRWSLMHLGGSYPLLRITARFLRVDYTRITVGFRAVADGVYVLCADPEQPTRAVAWAVVDFARPTSPEGARQSIQLALSSGT